MEIKSKIVNVFKLIFPASPIESGIFLLFFSVYGILGSYIAINYTVIFDSRIPWDAYFSFDNKSIVMSGGSFERHPLSYYFFNWLRSLALYISGGKTDTTFRLVLAWFSNLAVSLSILQIFKYLKNIIKLPFKVNLLLVIFFSFFSTSIILSFTPENFTYTLFLLTLFNHYSALKVQKEQQIPALALIFAGVSIGGLTVTNIVKVFIPVGFQRGLFKDRKKIGHAILSIILTCICFALLYLNRINFKYENIFHRTNEQYEKFSNVRSTPLWDAVLSYFFGENILLSNFIIRNKHNMQGFHYKGLIMDIYSSWIPYVFILILLLLILWSYVKNIKNKLVHILVISFMVDIIIHCILKFGIHTSYIYGGHFVFVYPLLLGWLFYAYRKSSKAFSVLTITVIFLSVYLVINNIIRMSEFFVFLDQNYQ
ncbi:DUF6080 domain-containing protein [Chryseobacterium fluminis]|uniref:DUF6080 domain-containing protein n=1 Tax=Chryseobacterium fluminis TaxID=2983606 RepID=UPI00224E279D|nr:DUF6080 domain-containing protein [Chryseobacterium sp. MMS21-Ot14]UZT96500.1 DUF6080 domain-containing protein [Chryseobacterium sp. MMS21-Ot14]